MDGMEKTVAEVPAVSWTVGNPWCYAWPNMMGGMPASPVSDADRSSSLYGCWTAFASETSKRNGVRRSCTAISLLHTASDVAPHDHE